MTKLDELYEYAERNQIEVDYFLLRQIKSLSAVMPDGTCIIAVDPSQIRSETEETVILGHEIGHCETNSFYLPTADRHTVSSCERKATRWAIGKLLPMESLFEAFSKGYSEPWEIAEYVGLPVDFVQKAMWFYMNGSLDEPRAEI